MIIKCCKDCKDRYPACHDHCPRYIEEKRRNDEIVANYRKQTDGRRQLDVMGTERNIKKFKRKGR